MDKSQSLAFISILIGRARGLIGHHAGDATAPFLNKLDELVQTYQEHENSIYDKIIGIMGRLAVSHVKSMVAIDWETNHDGVHPYMLSLVKDTVSLHRILTITATKKVTSQIMTLVFMNYQDQFGGALRTLNLKTEQARLNTNVLYSYSYSKIKLNLYSSICALFYLEKLPQSPLWLWRLGISRRRRVMMSSN